MHDRLLFGFRTRFHLFLVLLIASAFVPQRATSHPNDAGVVEASLHALVDQGAITEAMHTAIEAMHTHAQKEALANYLDTLTARGAITADVRIYLNSLLRVGVPASGAGPQSPAPAGYTGNGNVTLLGRLNPRAPFLYYSDNTTTGQLYEGIWGYAAAGREYALLTHSQGLTIIEVTNPGNPVALQFIPGVGGRVHHDIDTYYDPGSGKTYAYFGGQEGEHLYSIDLSYLPGTIPSSGIIDLGRTNYAHTLQVKDGLLFTNNAGSTLGCQVFDVQANPANPPLLTQAWNGTGRDCHDSFVRNGLIYSADGFSTRYRIGSISNIRAGNPMVPLGETVAKSGIYAHSNWLSDDSHYLYAFEEYNLEDINVFDVSNPANPVNVKTFQWSGDATANSLIHNGQIKGNLLYTAYYEAGFRVFDITDPVNPAEVGKYETWRDPDGDGIFNKSVTGNYNGAWNVYTMLPSGNILASDMLSGLFIFQVAPTTAPENTTTAIAAQSPNPSVTGQPYSVSVSVTPLGGSGTPSGIVAVSDGVGAACNATLAAGSGSCSLNANTAVTRTLTATYAGAAGFNGSTSAPVSHAVNAAGTTTAITNDTPDPSTTGQTYQITFSVSPIAPGAGTPTGNVTVNDGAGASCTASVAAGTCSLASSAAGPKTLTATYAGNGDFNGSSGTQAHQVNSVPTLPAAPANLTTTKVFTQQGKKTVLTRIDLNFTDNATNETDFRIERWKLTGQGRSQTCSLETTLTAPARTGTGPVTYGDTGATTATCKYRVAARNNAGTSAFVEAVP